ncbi:uncharacterized protein LOC109847935, partial [Asparagus officinalis]|uniref:uncharacterized protein LOC109847935 n=1 Tax=Asparagus officinalis TaxID=4686 RepID=UPI00098E7932
SAESSFRELDDVFLQTQTRIWLGEVLHIRFDEETAIADLLADGELLFQVSKLTWKMLLKKHVELTSSKVYIYERTSSGKSDGKYMPYPKVDSFLKVCQILGLTGIDLFSPSDVVEKRDVRRVCMCIRSFSKKARLENLNVPDFDKVTYTIAMPTEMVGGIRRTLEKSQYSSSSSGGYTSSSTEPMTSLGGQNTLHYDSYSESDEAESAYTEVVFHSSFSNASYDAAKLSNLMEMDSPEGDLVVDGDLSKVQTQLRSDAQEQIEVVDIASTQNFTLANGRFPHYLDGLNVVDEEENNLAQSSSSAINISHEHPKEEYINTVKRPSPEVQTIISDDNSISEQDTVYEKIYGIEKEVNAEGSNEKSTISTFKTDPSNSTGDGNNIMFYSIGDGDDQRVPSKISSPSASSVELDRNLENRQKTADEVEVGSEEEYANNDYTADNFSFPLVSDPKRDIFAEENISLMEVKISEKEVSFKRDIFAEERIDGKNQGDALIGSIKENEEADGNGKPMKGPEGCEKKLMPELNSNGKPKERAKGKKVLKSVVGAMTLIGALFLVNHVRQGRDKGKNTEENTEVSVPRQNGKPSQEFPEQKRVGVVKPASVYPGEKLKF